MAALLAVAAACGTAPASLAPAGAPAATDASGSSSVSPTVDAVAKLCPKPFREPCGAAVASSAAAGLASALCLTPPDGWAITTPAVGASTGEPCGPDPRGRIAGIIVPAGTAP